VVQELSPGTLLDHYELIRELGHGGMGVVFEAVDQKLGRHVAIKVLTEATRDSRAALERFWREAYAASSLNHPGICTIHELNESAETPFIVMELLEGNSLEKLCRGRALPYPKVLDLGMQVAGALDAAHRKGILHRDIKPANIFVTNSGQAKILDFGLAKFDSGVTDADASTVVSPLTESGSTVGTVAYMSPEQARGEPLDARSDLFSLGVVLYEMGTGRRPFDGATTAVIFDRILNESPAALTSLNPRLPVEFETIVNKTLEKDRDLRCQFAGELRADLKRLQRKSSSGSGPAAHASGTSSPGASSSAAITEARRSRRLAAVAACLVILAVAGFGAWRFLHRPRPFTTISVSQITNVGTIERIALSGDGRFLAEVKDDKGQRTLWVRNIATNTDTQILGAFANEYIGIAFSPDGNYLYFVRLTLENTAISALYVMPVFGGTPKQLIYDIDSIVSVSPDGSRFTYLQLTPGNKDQSSEIRIANKDGSDNEVVFATKEDAGPPSWSPKDNRIAWIGAVALDKYAIQIFDVASKKLTTVEAPPGISFPGPFTQVVWTPDGGHLLTFYLRPHSDHAQIGIVTLPSGDFHPVTNDVSAYSQLALSADGRTLATVLNNIDSSVAWYKSDGGEPLSTTALRITPQTIAWASEERLLFNVPHVDIGQIDRATGEVHTFDIGEIVPEDYISACPDGHILFTGVPKGASAPWVFRMDADGGNIVQLVTSGVAPSPGCSSDSREVFYFMEESEISKASLWVVPLSGGTPRQILPPIGTQEYAISSDGRLAALTIFKEQKAHWRVFDTSSGRMVSEVPLEMSDLAGEGSSTMRFSPDNRAAVYSVLRNAGRTLFYQPLDGSASHPLLEPIQEGIPDFNWSPSGKQLAIVGQKSSSDVVLIKDLDQGTRDQKR
jgi:eukaryotic-like serine/threonine-protein kinase